MAEYIEREAVIDEIESTTWYHISCQKNLVEGAAGEADALYKATDIYNVIKSVPTADVVEVVRGRWIKRQFADEPTAFCYRCSECHLTYEVDTNYCPNCGAKMDGGNNNA